MHLFFVFGGCSSEHQHELLLLRPSRTGFSKPGERRFCDGAWHKECTSYSNISDQVRLKLKEQKYKDILQKHNLERLIICADAVEKITSMEKVDSLPWSDLSNAVEALDDRTYRLPIDVARTLTCRFALDMFRSKMYVECMVAIWPSEPPHVDELRG
jgi:hypothetical protein